MGWLFWAALLLMCAVASVLVIRQPIRLAYETIGLDRARVMFHQRREWLEVLFLKSLDQTAPFERLRWEDAHWHDEIVWARDRQTRRLLALIEVQFDLDPVVEESKHHSRHATALFEFRKGQWRAEGKRLDETRPDEAFLHHKWFEPVVAPQRRD